MGDQILRYPGLIYCIIDISEDDDLSTEIDLGDVREFIVVMPDTWTSASIGFKVSPTSGGTFVPLYDDGGNLVQINSPAVDKAYAAPPEVGIARYVKLWSQDGSGSNTVQGADAVLWVIPKS